VKLHLDGYKSDSTFRDTFVTANVFAVEENGNRQVIWPWFVSRHHLVYLQQVRRASLYSGTRQRFE
jgi:hypothetical protein